ncbi:MAG: hypothetical protein ABI162_06210 [Luteolibacter sp.]
MNLAIPDRYVLAPDFEKRANDFDFPPEVWTVAAELAAVSKPTSPFELEQLTGQSSDQILQAIERLLAKQLVRQNLISWKEFTAAREKSRSAAKVPAAAQIAPVKVAPVSAIPSGKQAVSKPAPGKAAQSQANAKPAQEGVALRLGSISPQKTAVSTTNAWVWQKPDPAQVAASKPVIPASLPNGEQPNGRLLRPMLAQIENLKGGVEGQLLVYQVFLRVPYQLLHEEGIKALHLVDERTVIQNPALHAAIVKAAKDVTGVALA